MAAVNFVMPFRPAFDSNAIPIAGAMATFYYTGTSTKAPIYDNDLLTVEAANPVQANSAGRFPQTFLDEAITYRLVITNPAGAVIEQYDPYDPIEQGAVGPPGAAGNVAADLAQLKAAATTNVTMLYDTATFNWTLGNYTGQADDINIVQADGVPLTTGAWVRQSANALRLDDITKNVAITVGPTNTEDYGVFLNSSASDAHVDGFYVSHNISGAAGIGYCYHGIMTIGAECVGRGGGAGFAANGAGAADGVVGNRYEDGIGHGMIGTRVGTGDGYGAVGNFAGQPGATGGGVLAFKQNSTGVAGGPYGLGPALEATNISEEGTAISSLTAENNASLISNMFTRENYKEGLIADFRCLIGGARTGAFTGFRVLIQPSTASTGTGTVTGGDITLGANITGSAETSALLISNLTTGATNAFGVIISSLGANSTNRCLRLVAGNATNNIALEVIAGSSSFQDARISFDALPVYADQAAASAALLAGRIYRTATGELRIVY